MSRWEGSIAQWKGSFHVPQGYLIRLAEKGDLADALAVRMAVARVDGADVSVTPSGSKAAVAAQRGGDGAADVVAGGLSRRGA